MSNHIPSDTEKIESYLVSSQEVISAYVDLRDRMIAFLRELPEGVAHTTVPFCPSWTVQETVSHMVGVPDALLMGDLDGIASDEWTQRQVERHRGLSLAALADKWESQAEEFFKMLHGIPQPSLSQLVFDVASHEHDVRQAVGQSGGRNSGAVAVGVGFLKYTIAKGKKLDVSVIEEWPISAFEVFRTLGARRSLEQIAVSGLDPEFVKDAIAPLPLNIPAVSITE
jgi:uncharacterized protein (TIGR03083 family)